MLLSDNKNVQHIAKVPHEVARSGFSAVKDSIAAG